MTTYRRVEVIKKTIRHEYPAPVDAKTMRIALVLLEREFQDDNGRAVEFDNDFWLEPTDEGVAFVFEVEQRTGEVQG